MQSKTSFCVVCGALFVALCARRPTLPRGFQTYFSNKVGSTAPNTAQKMVSEFQQKIQVADIALELKEAMFSHSVSSWSLEGCIPCITPTGTQPERVQCFACSSDGSLVASCTASCVAVWRRYGEAETWKNMLMITTEETLFLNSSQQEHGQAKEFFNCLQFSEGTWTSQRDNEKLFIVGCVKEFSDGP
mmetsp:Transcript_19821/g.32497  ORF Transcript_19821/g.32497 Transcript_19821/m.32497 type:complete len:189 (-) Transcript_19821:325-891(-)